MTAIVTRIQALGAWGVPSSPALSVGVDTAAIASGRYVEGGFKNLRLYRKGSSGGVTQAAVGLDFQNVYSGSLNLKANWTATVPNAADFSQITNAFDSGLDGLLYSNGQASAPALFETTYTIAANAPWCVRLMIMTPHEDQPKQIIAFYLDRWRLEIIDGTLNMLRMTAAWTGAKQNALDALRASEDELSESDQDDIAALEAEIYEAGINGNIDVNKRKTDYGEWFEIALIPEPRGILNIISDHGESFIERTDITSTRLPGVVWPASKISITTNGGAMFWQIGKPTFYRSGTFLDYPFKWWNVDPITDPSFQGQVDSSSPGVGLSYSLDEIPDSIEYQFRADLTSDGRYTPFLYSIEAFVESGDRTGTNSITWDSNDVSDFTENGEPVMEVTPQYEQEMRRANATVLLRNIDGRLNFPGTVQQATHDKLCNLTLNGDPFITRGIIRAVQLGDMASGEGNITQAAAANTWSTTVFEVADQWQVMDDDAMMDCPKGDGLRVGAYLRRILKGAGVKDSEMTGVSAGAGRILPSAAPGEDFLIQPSNQCSRGDYLRSIVLDWGMGLVLYISRAGIWTLALPDVTVQAAFSSLPDEATYRILSPLDIVRDFSETYNWFCVEGAEINGRRLRQTWKVQESFNVPDWEGYLGRYKRFPTIQNDALRTQSDVAWVLRSRVRNHAKPGRFFSFNTNFHKHLIPGHYITVDGTSAQITRLDGGSIQFGNDRMGIFAQQVIGVGA